MMHNLLDSERPLPPTSSSESMPVMESPLLHTKLRVPGSTPTLLSRPRLINQLSLQPERCLTLLLGLLPTTAWWLTIRTWSLLLLPPTCTVKEYRLLF